MGRDARVYYKLEHLSVPPRIRSAVELVDSETGELDLKAGYGDSGCLLAASERLGNVAEVAFLREEIRRLIPARAEILLEKVLLSATLSGDSLPLSMVRTLEKELDGLDAMLSTASDPERLREFSCKMRRLCQAATQEANPIVF